ncbi:hypothetical protein [Bacillus sp. AK031]
MSRQKRRQLQKVDFAMSEVNLQKNIENHEDRGWTVASEVKKHGYGLGCLMTFGRNNKREGGLSND